MMHRVDVSIQSWSFFTYRAELPYVFALLHIMDNLHSIENWDQNCRYTEDETKNKHDQRLSVVSGNVTIDDAYAK